MKDFVISYFRDKMKKVNKLSKSLKLSTTTIRKDKTFE